MTSALAFFSAIFIYFRADGSESVRFFQAAYGLDEQGFEHLGFFEVFHTLCFFKYLDKTVSYAWIL